MTREASRTQSPERLAPLLRSIQREITERSTRMRALEERLEAFASTARAHAEEIALLQSELSTHRRELRRIASELSHLGVTFDAEHPHSIVANVADGGGSARSLEDTGFRTHFADARA